MLRGPLPTALLLLFLCQIMAASQSYENTLACVARGAETKNVYVPTSVFVIDLTFVNMN